MEGRAAVSAGSGFPEGTVDSGHPAERGDAVSGDWLDAIEQRAAKFRAEGVSHPPYDSRDVLALVEIAAVARLNTLSEGVVVSARSAPDHRSTWERYQEAKEKLTPEQIERIRAKCQWEQMSWLGVFEQWPSLFEAQP